MTRRSPYLRPFVSRMGLVVCLLLCLPLELSAETTLRPLYQDVRVLLDRLQEEGPILILESAATIETFLQAMEGEPPAWRQVFSASDPHDALFSLNRQRDARREARLGSSGRLCFFWDGELSDYDPQQQAFRVALGPRMAPTSWGVVRFKPEELPGDVRAVPPSGQRETLRATVAAGERVQVVVAFTGRLISEESFIYDIAHDEPRVGMILPVVRVERVDYALRWDR